MIEGSGMSPEALAGALIGAGVNAGGFIRQECERTARSGDSSDKQCHGRQCSCPVARRPRIGSGSWQERLHEVEADKRDGQDQSIQRKPGIPTDSFVGCGWRYTESM